MGEETGDLDIEDFYKVLDIDLERDKSQGDFQNTLNVKELDVTPRVKEDLTDEISAVQQEDGLKQEDLAQEYKIAREKRRATNEPNNETEVNEPNVSTLDLDSPQEQSTMESNPKKDLWMNRFSKWNDAVAKFSAKFAPIKLAITNAIKNILNERTNNQEKGR